MEYREHWMLREQAEMIVDYLAQKGAIKANDVQWRADFGFGMLLPRLLPKEAAENPCNRFEKCFYKISDKEKHNLRINSYVEEYGCSIDDPVRLGIIAYLYFDECKEFDKHSCKLRKSDNRLERILYKEKYNKYIGAEFQVSVANNLRHGEEKISDKNYSEQFNEDNMRVFTETFYQKFIVTPDDPKRKKDDDIEAKAWVFQEWKRKWNEINDGNEYQHFVKMFNYDYEVTCRKIYKNKSKNFWIKAFAVGQPLIMLIIGVLAVYNNPNVITKILTGVAAVSIVISDILLQWIEVKKFQETWVRHEKHKFTLDDEMLKFISNTEEYNSIENKKIFRDRIMKSWEENNKQFVKNMKNEGNIKSANSFDKDS